VTPLPPPLGTGELVAWRLEEARFAATWDSGTGPYLYGGRWNSQGIRAVYCSLDPACAILEVAVHRGFKALDTVPHILTSLRVDPARAHVVEPAAVPNPNWLRPGTPSAGQQQFGDTLLAAHALVVLPSAVSTESWNLVFVAATAAAAYSARSQDRFALDPRLHPPP
jgi:RES domain-containing protein